MKNTPIILLVLIVIGFVVWWLWPQTAPLRETPIVVGQQEEASQVSSQGYTSTLYGFSVVYPTGYTRNEQYEYQTADPTKTIPGVSFHIPTILADTTNLSTDTRISIEKIPGNDKMACLPFRFLSEIIAEETIVEQGVEYRLATSGGAGAGNLYEEIVYVPNLPGNAGCYGIRYFIHSGNIANYEPGTMAEFDRTTLLAEFDRIRHSVFFEE